MRWRRGQAGRSSDVIDARRGGLGRGVDGPRPAADGRGIPGAQDPERDLREFSGYVFSRTLNTWEELFAEEGRPFERAKVVLYRDAAATGCGNASSAVGPFYCPADQRVYLDLSFYNDMETEIGAPGDFAWAYVIAHEVGHHVQKQLGTSDEVSRLQRDDPSQANAFGAARAPGGLLRRGVGAQRLRLRRPR